MEIIWTYSTTDGNYYAVVSIGFGTGDTQTVKISI